MLTYISAVAPIGTGGGSFAPPPSPPSHFFEKVSKIYVSKFKFFGNSAPT